MHALSENALTVLKKRYLIKNEQGEPTETPEDMFMRVAWNIALMDILYHPEVFDREGREMRLPLAEDEPGPENSGLTPWDFRALKAGYHRLAARGKMRVGFDRVLEVLKESRDDIEATSQSFYQAMICGELIPNSPTLMNAGRELQQLSACFVLPIEDSMESIFEALKNTALIHKSGGGTGFSFSRLRPQSDQVQSTGGIASGPVSFLKVYDSATEAVKQGGTRRGANMGILRVDHPDILDFIVCKGENSDINNFNISVGVTEEFMKAVYEDEEYELVNPRNGEVSGCLRAREVFDLMVEMAWKNGEPGIIFLDRINRHNPTPHLGEVESTNPCGEQPLLPYESCNLLSINLSRCLSSSGVDYQRLRQQVHLGVHFLDNVIEANRFPLREIEEMTLRTRKVGMGVMGWAELLIRLGIPYDSEEAVALAEEVMGFIQREAREKSHLLALERGAFPAWEGSRLEQEGMPIQRNATTTTIAPTGSISIIAGTSSGIEPLFSLAFTRHVLDGEKLVEVNSLLEETARQEGLYSDEFLEALSQTGTLKGMEGVPEEIQRTFVTALEISPEWHIRMQAAFQNYTDNAVSKTCNFPNVASREDVARAYQLAYQLGCKGVTVYRDGSRQGQVLQVGRGKEEEAQGDDSLSVGPWGKIRPVERPARLQGITERKATPMGNLWLTLNVYDGHPFEFFAQIGKAGSDVSAFTESLARLISLAFRCGVDPWETASQLVGIGGSRHVGFGPNRVRSVPDAMGQFIAEALEKMEKAQEQEGAPGQAALPLFGPGDGEQLELGTLSQAKQGQKTERHQSSVISSFALCPTCGTYAFMFVEGCGTCAACGYSEC